MLCVDMDRRLLIGVLAGALLLSGGVGLAAASGSSGSAQFCAADAQALANFAEHGPTLTPTIRATVARLIARYEQRRARCGLSIHVPTGGGGYESVGLMTVEPNAHVTLPTPAVAAATSTGGRHTFEYVIGPVAAVLLVAAGLYYRRRSQRRRVSAAQ
jgi:hypothetical protein